MQTQPFKRFFRIYSLLEAALALADAGARVDALATVPEYVSRGHGGGHHHGISRHAAHKKARYSSGKYSPHQGKQEIARRVSRQH